MTKVLKVTKLRFVMITLSVILIAGGLVGTFVMNDGLNLGIDFRAGLNLQVQIADIGMTVSYSGEKTTLLNIENGVLTIVQRQNLDSERISLPFTEYTTLASLASALNSIEGVNAEILISGNTASSNIIRIDYQTELGEDPLNLNIVNTSDSYITIDEMREYLVSIESAQIQVVGTPSNQEFLIRVGEDPTIEDFNSSMVNTVKGILGTAFGSSSRILIKKTDYIGARFSQSLSSESIILIGSALALILLYIWFRFKLAYAISAIAALVHDVLFMIGVIGVFQLEVSTATIAAVLTIVGYSLNDTIVIFDRIRENVDLMRDSDLEHIVNTSITQSLSRTLITSITTLLAVLAIYVFGTGQIQDFALNLIVGILVGTYSSLFIASPIFLTWMKGQVNRAHAKDAAKFGIRTPEKGSDAGESAMDKKVIEIPTAERKLKGKRKKKK